ncbi:MAG: VCBS repeat-containing protein [Myxococcota bacterium]
MPSLRLPAAACLLVCAAARVAGAEDPFELRRLASPGRTALAEIVDLDGDGRADVFSVAFAGLPPDERREIRVHFQREDGSLPDRPDWVAPLITGAMAYDVADLSEARGSEILFLARDRIAVLSLADRKPALRGIPIPDHSLGVAPDEGGLERLRIVRDGLGPEPRLLVPGLAETFVLTPAGEVVGRIELASRVNYFVPVRPGPLLSESEIELDLDFPRLETGDVDGDARADLITAQRHELRVFLQRPGGRFESRPDRLLPLGLLSETDHIRNSGSVRVTARDIDGDGLVDLVVSHAAEGLFRARSETRVHLNRAGSWDLRSPDQVFHFRGGFSTIELLDLDGDGRPELLDARIPLSILELVEILVTRAIDARLAIYRANPAGDGPVFGPRPWFQRKLGIPMNFETFRPRGFAPTLAADVNGDGYRDLLESAGGEGIEVYLGGAERPYRKRVARQDFDSSGRIRFGDFDGDGLADFLLYDQRRPDTPLLLGVNRGVLPGTPARARLSAP